QRATRSAAVAQHRRRLAELTEAAPDNLGNRLALVDAEIARLEGRELDAERLYERSIRLAREHRFVQVEALAAELAPRFHLARGLETIGNAYLAASREAYVRWGALGKVRQLDARYPSLRRPEERSPATALDLSVKDLDLATVVKVYQAVSAEIVLDALLEQLL